MSVRAQNRLVWFALLGGATAWATQFVLAMQLGLARCEPPAMRFAIPIEAWSIGLAAGAALFVVGAELVAIAIFRVTRSAEGRTEERIHFLAIVALTINPLLLALVVMDGVGVPVLTICQQS